MGSGEHCDDRDTDLDRGRVPHGLVLNDTSNTDEPEEGRLCMLAVVASVVTLTYLELLRRRRDGESDAADAGDTLLIGLYLKSGLSSAAAAPSTPTPTPS